MQIASILSDLTSLRVCDHTAALALVSVHKSDRAASTADEDQDMQRAMDLVELHYGVKMKQARGEDAVLRQARRQVDVVLEKLQGHGLKTQGSGG